MGALSLTSKLILVGVALATLLGGYAWFVHKQREVGREQIRSEVLNEAIKETDKHIKIDEGQNEIHNRAITDAELLDSLQRGDF